MTPSLPNPFLWRELPVSALSSVRAVAAELLSQVGRPLARTARTVRSGRLGLVGLRTLLAADFYGPAISDGAGASDSPRARFEQLSRPLLQSWPGLSEEAHLRGVATQLHSLDQLHAEVLAGNDAATAQAMGIALSIERLLQELLEDLDRELARPPSER